MKRWASIAAVLLIVVPALGCQRAPDGARQAEDAAVPAGDNAALPGSTVPSDAAPAPGVTSASPSEPGTPEFMVASGQATLPPQTPWVEPTVPPIERGVERTVTLAEAIAGVPFALLAPRDLPAGASLKAVDLIAAPEGETDPSLPAVRMLYHLDADRTLVFLQSPAISAPAEGEALKVGAHDAWLRVISETTIVTWEQDGVRVEAHGIGIDRDGLLAIAAAMAPARE